MIAMSSNQSERLGFVVVKHSLTMLQAKSTKIHIKSSILLRLSRIGFLLHLIEILPIITPGKIPKIVSNIKKKEKKA